MFICYLTIYDKDYQFFIIEKKKSLDTKTLIEHLKWLRPHNKLASEISIK